METVGLFLKNERESQGKSLKDISEATRISKTTLQAIEEDIQELLPPFSYVRGFLRIYAKELGLNPGVIIEMFEKELKEKRYEPPKVLKVPGAPLRKQNYNYIYIIIGIVFLVFLIYFANKDKDTEMKKAGQKSIGRQTIPVAPAVVPEPVPPVPEEGLETAPHELISEEAIPKSPPMIPISKSPASEVLPQDENFTVRFVASELTWIKFTVDNRDPFDITLWSGESYKETAEECMMVRIGNAGGVSLFFNDIPLGILGKKGEPIDLQFPEAAEGF